ncbi:MULTISPECIES: adenylate/guanylate cyclase domain-containing protein [Gordonia]|uniref:adenylate/guanylate cyclase domain-containing protein n=1 Tax=Gordonia TaxID=2053 RepID=UPI0005869A87|nr:MULTISPECIES: adenylate/guanylate cyclase domain-containing protein [Gordonia]AUH67800.1 adenylate/guanylate cyclase domain-containing protein [Gordonia sp. YC-JH1]MBY4568889.1 adenylate/guanylate cyclase domain-containing protein [Gordonia sihwensis]WFN92508.1 adenylate/guanylate cyclase domain-containing protein [Gordonia sihwensis]
MVRRRSWLSRAAHTLRWLAHTPWPVLALDMLRANLIGALFTFAFLRFGMPRVDSISISEFNAQNQVAFGLYLFIAIIVGAYLSIQLSMPVLIWHRRRTRLDDAAARKRALNLPTLLTAVNLGLWGIGGVILAVINLRTSMKDFVVVIIASLIGALVTGVLSFMQAEKVLRPITVAAMANDPDNSNAPGIATRITVFWVVSVAVPMTIIAALIILQRTAVIDTDAVGLQRPILWMAAAALVFGLLAITRLVRSITDPVKQLRVALNQVRAGNLNVAVKIYDGNDLGLLQAGFNEMVSDLRERQQLRNLFGRYVGEDVARRAIETGTELGGEERYVGVLFVDIVGSTRLAVNRPPREVVELLNEFFKVVVDVVGRHGGFVNKFQGDAALAIFGAPLEQDDFAGSALAAARDLRVELARRLGDVDMGIGVSAGKAVAGHIGAEQRLEYTVIGDPVNEAARLTELAKDEPTRVLGSARAVFLAGEGEAEHWRIGEGVELRGRGIETLLARPDIDVAEPTSTLE